MRSNVHIAFERRPTSSLQDRHRNARDHASSAPRAALLADARHVNEVAALTTQATAVPESSSSSTQQPETSAGSVPGVLRLERPSSVGRLRAASRALAAGAEGRYRTRPGGGVITAMTFGAPRTIR